MSKKELTVSDAEPEELSIDSVYDFLYHDAQRVGSFIAQLDRFGHLQKVISNESAAKGVKRGYSLKLSGSIPVPGSVDAAEGGLTFGRDPSQSGSESLSREYDPLWTNALVLLDYLDERGLIESDIAKAKIGQFVVVSGSLQVLNAAILKPLIEQRTFVDSVMGGAREHQKTSIHNSAAYQTLPNNLKAAFEKKSLKTWEDNSRVMLGYFPNLPHLTQSTLTGDGFSVWCSLKDKWLVGSADELVLKHGTEIPGEWHLFGILDAVPDQIPPQLNVPYTGVMEHFEPTIKNLSNMGRTMLGRKAEAYGMVPILLFRPVR